MGDVSTPSNAIDIACTKCQTPVVLEACFKGNGALAHPRAKNTVRMIMGCQCQDTVPQTAPCPDCGVLLHFRRQADGVYLAPHEHCEGRKQARGL